MTILLQDLWQIGRPSDFKVHFARWNKIVQPLEVFVRDRAEWQSWHEYRPTRNEFNRPFIFSLMQFYREEDSWLFGGIYKILERHSDRYEVRLVESGQNLIGRLKLQSPYRGRGTRGNFEKHYTNFEVLEIFREPYSGQTFPGFENVDLSFEELEALVKNERQDWMAALRSVCGIYLISDVSTSNRYIGAAYGAEGIWSRWSQYVSSGHGDTAELRDLVFVNSIDYCRANLRFALLESHPKRTPDQAILEREGHWKKVMLTRGGRGLNRN